MEEIENTFGLSSQRVGSSEMVEGDLIRLIPLPSDSTCQCLNCFASGAQFDAHVFQGMHVLSRFKCMACAKHTWHTLPAGHDGLFPVAFGENGINLTIASDAATWLIRPLLDSLFDNFRAHAPVEVEEFRRRSDTIVLNCLDNRFGHAFAKLWNASSILRKYPGVSLIVIIPKNLRWLVPDGVDIIWTVDTPLATLNQFLTGVEEQMTRTLQQFNNVWLSKAFTHLRPEYVDFQAMLRTSRFPITSFSDGKPHITFVLREDRLWHGSAFGYFLFRIAAKLRLPKTPFVVRQNRRVNRTARYLKKKLPAVEITVAGLGRSGALHSTIRDLRREKPSPDDEMQWCRWYAKTHIVIGVHGSNMLIPTALSAGFIEILPREKIRHMAEDVLIVFPPRLSIFLGRHVDAYVSTHLIATHAASMINHFPYLFNNWRQTI